MDKEELEARINDIHYVITIADLESALRNTLGEGGVLEQEVKTTAEFIMNFFGFETYLLDNYLTCNERDMFYILEGYKLLSTKEYEIQLRTGKTWRIFEWVLNKETILRLAYSRKEEVAVRDESSAVYDTLDESMWVRA